MRGNQSLPLPPPKVKFQGGNSDVEKKCKKITNCRKGKIFPGGDLDARNFMIAVWNALKDYPTGGIVKAPGLSEYLGKKLELVCSEKGKNHMIAIVYAKFYPKKAHRKVNLLFNYYFFTI